MRNQTWAVIRLVVGVGLLGVLVWACSQVATYENRRTVYVASGEDCHEGLRLRKDCPDWDVKPLPDEAPCEFVLEAGHRAIFSAWIDFQIPAHAPDGVLAVGDWRCEYSDGGVEGCSPGTWVVTREVAFAGRSGVFESQVRYIDEDK